MAEKIAFTINSSVQLKFMSSPLITLLTPAPAKSAMTDAPVLATPTPKDFITALAPGFSRALAICGINSPVTPSTPPATPPDTVLSKTSDPLKSPSSFSVSPISINCTPAEAKAPPAAPVPTPINTRAPKPNVLIALPAKKATPAPGIKHNAMEAAISIPT